MERGWWAAGWWAYLEHLTAPVEQRLAELPVPDGRAATPHTERAALSRALRHWTRQNEARQSLAGSRERRCVLLVAARHRIPALSFKGYAQARRRRECMRAATGSRRDPSTSGEAGRGVYSPVRAQNRVPPAPPCPPRLSSRCHVCWAPSSLSHLSLLPGPH